QRYIMLAARPRRVVGASRMLAVPMVGNLFGRRVPPSHGTRATIAFKPLVCALRRRAAAVEVIDRPGTTAALDRVQRPTEKPQRLLRTADAIERVNRERRVAQPRIAIIPVALAADHLGQRRGRRRHDRAALKVIEQLERQRRAAHYLFPRPFVSDARSPSPPGVAPLDRRAFPRQ